MNSASFGIFKVVLNPTLPKALVRPIRFEILISSESGNVRGYHVREIQRNRYIIAECKRGCQLIVVGYAVSDEPAVFWIVVGKFTVAKAQVNFERDGHTASRALKRMFLSVFIAELGTR